jgi:hypothetical protein
MPREYNNPIGENIYNRIKEYDIISRKVFLSNLSTEHRAFYNKYSAVIRKRNSLSNADNKAKANEKAREGMKKLRELRTPDEIKEQRKPYDAKYYQKTKMTRDEASSIIQKQFRNNKQKIETLKITTDILNDIIDNSFNKKIVNGQVKPKRGRRLGQVAKIK